MRTLTYRSLALVGAGILTAAALTSCSSSSSSGGGGGGSSSGGAASAPASTGGGAGSGSAAAGASLQALYQQAKSEGKVVVWGGEDPDELQQAFDNFSKTYPGIKLEFTANNPDQQASKMVAAKAAGQTLPDIIQGRLEYMPTLEQQNLIDKDPKWASYGVPSNIISYDGGVVEYRSLYVLAYNKNQVKDPSALPKTWDALDDAQWKGKLSLDPRGFPFNVLSASKGEQATVDFVKKLKSDTSPTMVQGSTAGLVDLSAGAHAVRPAAIEDVKTQLAKNAPLGYVVPSPALVQDTLWYLTANAKDSAAATLFAIWYTSATGGQVQMMQQDNRNNQVPAAASGMTVVSYESADQAATVAKATPEIAAVLGGS